MNKWILYCTICTETGKIYIGVHKTKTPYIFDGYIGNGVEIGYKLKNPHTAFQYALKKYGYNKFKRITLQVFNSEEEAYKRESEIVTIDFVKQNDNYNTSLGGINPGTNPQSLYQYSLDGKFIKEWYSYKEAIEYYGCNTNRFNMVITDKRSAFNSFWSRDKTDILDVSDYKRSKHAEIYCYNLLGELLNVYTNVTDIKTTLNLSKSSIDDAMSRKRPLKGYYFLPYNINVMEVIKTRTLIYNLTDNSVSKYNNGKLIQTYTSLKRAALESKVKQSEIKKSIKNKDGVWMYGYSEEYNPNNQDKIPLKIDQFDKEGNLIKTWESYSKCRKEFPNIRDALSGGRSHIKGYTFRIHK